MDFVILVGRLLFVLLFLYSAIGHFTQTSGMAAYAHSKGVPAARPAVLVSGVLMLLASISILLGIWPDLGALVLTVYLIITAFMMHGFWQETDTQTKQSEVLQFLKDLSLAGAALTLFGLFVARGEELGLVMVRPAFG